MSYFETRDGLDIYFEWVGSQDQHDCVVFLHDGLGSTSAWGDVPERICGALGIRGIVYDRLGYGRSSALERFEPGLFEREVGRLLELLDYLEVECPRVVGHSDGGSISLLFAATYPERVRSVVAEAPHTFVESTTRNGLRDFVAQTTAEGLPGWLIKQHGDRAPHVFETWTSLWLNTDQNEFDIREDLKRLRVPVFVVQGLKDEFGTIQQVASLLDHCEDLWIWAPADCGHVPHSELEEEFCQRVIRFLADSEIRLVESQ